MCVWSPGCENTIRDRRLNTRLNDNHASKREKRISTGIAGLDQVLNGGLPENHFYLVEGDPGTGKTTLALQFLLEGRKEGESVLYVTLSETESELRTVAESHGWSLDGVGLFELGSIEERLSAEEQYTVFHPADVELSETTKRICEEVDKSQATRVVFDSLSEMRLLAREPLRYRRQVLALKQFFAGRKCTVLLLDDRGPQQADLQLQSISHGVILLERIAVEYGGARRRLTVLKMRGLEFTEGHHDYSIKAGGLVLYPRLIASQSRNGGSGDHSRQEAHSGKPELDLLLGGGLPYGTSTLIMGPAGSGKSTLVSQYARHLAEEGKRVVCYVFEETRENFLERSDGLGMDLRGQIARGNMTVDQVDPAELSPGEFIYKLREAVEKDHAKVVIIDSLNGYLNAMPSETFLLIQMHELLVYLNERGVLTMIVLAQHGLLGTGMHSPVDVTYLADSVILLRYFEAFGEVRQAIAVIKKRTGGHERTIRQFEITARGITIGKPLTDFEGVLTGIPVYNGKRENLIPGPVAIDAPVR